MKKVVALIVCTLSAVSVVALSYWQPASPQTTDGSSNNPAELARDYDIAVKNGDVHLPAPDGKQPPTRSETSKESAIKTPKYGAGKTLIRTNQPEAVLEYSRQNELAVREVRQAKDGKTVITLDEEPDSPKIKNLTDSTSAKASANYRYHVLGHSPPNDPRYDEQWNLQTISAPQAWHTSTGSNDTVIAIIDTGVLFDQTVGDPAESFTQPDFPETNRWQNQGEIGLTTASDTCWTGTQEDKATNNCDDDGNGYKDDWQGWDFMGGWSGAIGCPNYDPNQSADTYIASDNDPNPYSCDSPDHPTELNKTHYNGTCTAFESACYVGHGTLVGSVAAAETNNGALIAGINHDVSVMNLRVLDGYGFTTTDRVTEAVRYAAANGADVINLSLGVGCNQDFTDPVMEDALQDAKNAGVIVVAASGNGGLNNSICYPASSPAAIAVGATDRNDKRASFSNGSKKLDVMAPGQDIPAANAPSDAYPASYYSGASGTSLSTPHVAGAVALLKTALPKATFTETYQLLTAYVDNIPQMKSAKFTKQHGFGRLNIHKALKRATLIHPDGSLVKSPGTAAIYLLENGEKRPITSMDAFYSHGFRASDVRPATPSDRRLPTGQVLGLKEGTIIKPRGKEVIYAIDHKSGVIEKRAFTSLTIFRTLGFSSEDVRLISRGNAQQPVGEPINSAASHPDGILVKASSEATVYLLEDGKKRLVPSPLVLYSHRLDWGAVKEATPADQELATGIALGLREGVVLKGEAPAIYVINLNDGTIEKRSIASFLVFKLLDYRIGEVRSVKNERLPEQTGVPIS